MQLPASAPARPHRPERYAGQTRKRQAARQIAHGIWFRGRQGSPVARPTGEGEMKKSKTAAPPVFAPLAPALAGPLLHTHLTLVETAEPELLEELLADRRIGPLLAARLSDCVAVVA